MSLNPIFKLVHKPQFKTLSLHSIGRFNLEIDQLVIKHLLNSQFKKLVIPKSIRYHIKHQNQN